MEHAAGLCNDGPQEVRPGPELACSHQNPLRCFQVQIPGPTSRKPGAEFQLHREVLMAAGFGKPCSRVPLSHSEALKRFLPPGNFNFWCFYFTDTEIYLWTTLKTGLALSTGRWFTENILMENLWRSKPDRHERNTWNSWVWHRLQACTASPKSGLRRHSRDRAAWLHWSKCDIFLSSHCQGAHSFKE